MVLCCRHGKELLPADLAAAFCCYHLHPAVLQLSILQPSPESQAPKASPGGAQLCICWLQVSLLAPFVASL